MQVVSVYEVPTIPLVFDPKIATKDEYLMDFWPIFGPNRHKMRLYFNFVPLSEAVF